MQDYKNENVWLMHGDCLERMKEIPDGSVDAVICDPPYEKTIQKWDKHIDFKKMWRQLDRITKSNSAILIFAKPPFDKLLACSNIENYRYDWIWEKSRATGHYNSSIMPLQAHESICVFYKNQPTYNPQKTTGHKPVNKFYTRTSGGCYGHGEKITSGGGSTERFPRSVLKYKPVHNKNRLHSNQKPVDLVEFFVKTYTNEGETVLDFTMGSGTTGVAAANTGRRFIGIELDDKYYQIAKERILG